MPSIKKLHALFQVIFEGIISVSLIAMVIGCAGTKPGTGYVDDTPDDIQKLITKEYAKSLYAVGTSVGPDEGTATRKATMEARAEIARVFKSQVDVLQKNYEESINDKTVAEYQQVIEIFANLEMAGSTIAKSMVRQEKDGTYSSKVLVVISAEQLKALLDEKLQAYTSYKASKAYQELEERVAKEKETSAMVAE